MDTGGLAANCRRLIVQLDCDFDGFYDCGCVDLIKKVRGARLNVYDKMQLIYYAILFLADEEDTPPLLQYYSTLKSLQIEIEEAGTELLEIAQRRAEIIDTLQHAPSKTEASAGPIRCFCLTDRGREAREGMPMFLGRLGSGEKGVIIDSERDGWLRFLGFADGGIEGPLRFRGSASQLHLLICGLTGKLKYKLVESVFVDGDNPLSPGTYTSAAVVDLPTANRRPPPVWQTTACAVRKKDGTPYSATTLLNADNGNPLTGDGAGLILSAFRRLGTLCFNA